MQSRCGRLIATAWVMLAGATHALAQPAAPAASYEIWAMDQGTHVVHVFDPEFRELARLDLGALGARVPHMIEFTSDYRYAFVANPASGNVAVIRAADRELVALVATGPRTHHAAVAPDDRTVLVSVIGAPDAAWDGKLVELTADLENERFERGRELVVADDPLFAPRRAEFRETAGAICLAFTGDGNHGYVTLGPSLEEGGLVVVDMQSFRLVEVHARSSLNVNCGAILAPDGQHMFLAGGDRGIGVWHVADTRSHRPVHHADSRGHDTHGAIITPDGRELWMVNRSTSNALIVDTRSFEVLHEIPFVGKTPDILAMSPDGRFAFVTLRGPNPVTMPHLAVGETPGIAVIDVASRELVRVVEPAKGDERSDFHGIAVRPVAR